jgi:hypothetical protein
MQVESVLHRMFDRRGQVTKARCRTFLNAVLTPEPPPALKGPTMTHSKFDTHNAVYAKSSGPSARPRLPPGNWSGEAI